MKSIEAAPSLPESAMRSISVCVNENYVGLRLDQFIVLSLPYLSRSAITNSIKKGFFSVDGDTKKSSYRLKINEHVVGSVEHRSEPDLNPEKIDFVILHEDDLVIIVSKPPGLVVHPGAGVSGNTLVNGLLYHCLSLNDVGESTRPGIVHRLDKDTSGVMVVAKTEAMHLALVEDFKNHRVEKEYLALVHGILREKSGRIVESIGRHPVNRQKMAVRQIGGKHAASNYLVLEELDNRYSLIKVGIETGRTHQIRVHMSHLGHPIAGDTVYGPNRDNAKFPRQLLHAYRLAFPHPKVGAVVYNAPLWPDFLEVLKLLGSEYMSGRGIP